MKKIYLLPFLMFAISSCSNKHCDCIDEMNSMNYTSVEYNECISMARNAGATNNPYKYHQKKCDD